MEVATEPKSKVSAAKLMLDKEAEDLRGKAKTYYTQMQKNWYEFAKVLIQIKTKDIFSRYGHETLKDFCEREFPNLNYSVIVKTLKVVEDWGKTLEDRIKKDPNYVLPAVQTCYELGNAQDKLPKEEFNRLKKLVLDNKLSFHQFRDKLKEIVDGTTKKAKADVETSVEKLKEEIIEKIDEKPGATAKGEDTDDDNIEVFDPKSEKADVARLVREISVRVAHVRDNLPILKMFIEKNSELADESVVALATELEDLTEKSEDFFNLMESI